MLNTVAIYKFLQLQYVVCAVCPAVLVMELPARNPWRPEGAASVHRTVPSRTRRSRARGQGGASSGAIALSGREQEAAAHTLPRLVQTMGAEFQVQLEASLRRCDAEEVCITITRLFRILSPEQEY